MYVRIVTGIVIPNLRFWVLVFSKYPRARCNLFQSSCVGCSSLFDSSDIVVSRSCLVRVEMYISLATVEWKIICSGSGSRTASVFMSNKYGLRRDFGPNAGICISCCVHTSFSIFNHTLLVDEYEGWFVGIG